MDQMELRKQRFYGYLLENVESVWKTQKGMSKKKKKVQMNFN